MKDTLKTCFSFFSYGLFYLAITACLVGTFLTTLHVTGVVKNFDMLLTYYTVVSFGIWLLIMPLVFLKKLRTTAGRPTGVTL